MRILIVGAGSTGGYFGGRLAQAGRDVTFLVRPGRAESLRLNGLRIVSPHGDVTLTPKVVTAEQIRSTYDVVVLAVKAFAIDAAMDDLAPAVGAETMILPVLNGMRHVDVLTSRFGNPALVGCACKIASMIDDQGRIVQLTPLHDIAYGEMDGSISDRTNLLDETMRRAAFDARLSPTIARDMWEKWILLATVGGINCLMRGNIGQVQAAAGGPAFMAQFFDEVTAVVGTVGIAPSKAFLTAAAATLQESGSTMTTSMYRDLLRGSPIEAEQIVGDLVSRAQRAGIETPLLAAAYTHLSVFQAQTSK